MKTSRFPTSIFVLSVLISVIVSILPQPLDWNFAQPYWTALVLIYWHIEAPENVGIGSAFFIGIGLDAVSGNLLGEHALGLVVMAFIALKFHRRLRFFPMWQQALAVAAILFNDRVLSYWIRGLSGQTMPDIWFWTTPLFGLAVWPWLFMLLDRIRHQRR